MTASARRPVTAVHLGLGAFHRAHQAWYTAADPEAGVAAYTFRSTGLPRRLTEQGGRYHLLVRGDGDPVPSSASAGPRASAVPSSASAGPRTSAVPLSASAGPRASAVLEPVDVIVRARPGSDLDSWRADVAARTTSVLTLTVTEAGLRDPSTAARILDGLRVRRTACGAPIALVPCDNLPGNGDVLRASLLAAAEPDLASWIGEHVAFVDTVVDRITPATTDDDVALVARLLPAGVVDAVPVVTEAYREWVLAGRFPLGRPAWENGGARFVDDVAPFARRKLWFLNGAHSLLAYTGPALRVSTVDEAVRDERLAGLLGSWWDAAARHLGGADSGTGGAAAAAGPGEGVGAGMDTDGYRAELAARFANRGIRHRLAQIARDGSQKVPARILPVLARERADGRMPRGAVAALGGWVAHLRAGRVEDPRADELVTAARAGGTRAVLRALGAPPRAPGRDVAPGSDAAARVDAARVAAAATTTGPEAADRLTDDAELIAAVEDASQEFHPDRASG